MSLTNEQASKAASIIFDAYRAGAPIEGLPVDCAPANAADAVLVQEALLARFGMAAAGYKAGFTNPPALAKAGPDGPMSGVMFRDFTVPSGGTLKRADIWPGTLIEAEVAFRMAQTLPVRDSDYSQDEVLDAVDSAIIAIEVAVPRFANPLGQPVPFLFAENGAALGFVWGPDIPDWRNGDLKTLEIELSFDGEAVAQGLPLEARCDEAWALTWTVNHFRVRGRAVEAGAFITTGAAAAPTVLGNTSQVSASYAGIGDVSFTVEA